MDTAQETLKKDLRSLVDQATTLRDEIRMQIHLAGLDAKDVWRKLEPDLARTSDLAQQVSKSSLAAVEDTVCRARKLARSVREEAEAHRTSKH